MQYAQHIFQNYPEMAPISIYWACPQYLEDHKGIFPSSICRNLFIGRICWIKSFLLTFRLKLASMYFLFISLKIKIVPGSSIVGLQACFLIFIPED